MNCSFSPLLKSARHILRHAFENKYAVAQINTNNLEWTKIILQKAQELKSPVIIGVSEGAVKHFGGFNTVVKSTIGLIEDLEITIPIILHLDHGSYEGCKKAINAGFSSVMYDGSHSPFEENLQKSIEIIKLANLNGVSVELEVGIIGGEEDGLIGTGENADLNQCIEIGKLDLSMLAASIGNIHGLYPSNWKGLNFQLLASISKHVHKPLVLHGGTNIPEDQIKKSIALGISKINVNTELQLAFAAALRNYFFDKKDQDMAKKGFDPRKIINTGVNEMAKVIEKKFTIFGSINKS